MKAKMCLFSILMSVFFLEIIIASPVKAAIRIMPLGDSITQGEGSGIADEDYQVAYRKSLWDLLNDDGYDVDFVGSQDTGSAVFDDSQHEGLGGRRADEIRDNIYNWLVTNPADIILLHIGRNDITIQQQDPIEIVSEVSQVLDEIDRYESNLSANITVILALIINRLGYNCFNASTTTTFNDDLYDMAQDRIDSGDRIEIIDMECGAGIDYREQPDGDMYSGSHPVETGYEKMADLWIFGFQTIQPVADAGSNQSVNEFNLVTLDGSNSSDHFGTVVSYLWIQTQGSAVVLSDSQSANPTFTAPDVGPNGETLTFQLTVTDAVGLESTDTTNVDVSNDNCPNDPNKTQPGICGCGISDTDSGGDGIPDCNDDCDNLIDSDGDGTNDCDDLCPNDPNKTQPGTCGCNIADKDSDEDGTLDCEDANDDNDGLLDGEEQGPDGNDQNYDGNDDGVPDRLQDNVVSFHTYDNQNYVTLASPKGTSISNCKAVDNPSTANSPSGVEFSYGFFNFTITGVGIGGATTVTLHLPLGETIDTYYKYGRTPLNPTNNWYEFLYDGETGAEISGNIITLHFFDGKRGDDDLIANGIVIDDGAPAVAVAPGVGPTVSSDGGGGGGCFIATAAYGSLMEPHVKILRDFRDHFLLGNTVGDSFVRLYYTYSPPIADFIAKYDSLRAIVRISLLPVVGVSWIALKIGPVSTMALMIIFIFCFVGVVRFRGRHKE